MLCLHPSTRFKRSYKKLPAAIKKDFDKKINIFQKHPFYPTLKAHKLSGNLDDYYSFYLRDGYRVLFEFVAESTVLLVNIGSHDDYKKWN